MELLKSGMKFESNKEYIASGKVIEVYKEDTFSCDNKEVLASSRAYSKTFPVGFLLENIENTVLDFNNATVMFHGRIVPFILINCKNVVIKNLKIDYDRPFYTQADVLNVDNDRIEIKITDGFNYEVKNGYLYAKSETWEKILIAMNVFYGSMISPARMIIQSFSVYLATRYSRLRILHCLLSILE